MPVARRCALTTREMNSMRHRGAAVGIGAQRPPGFNGNNSGYHKIASMN